MKNLYGYEEPELISFAMNSLFYRATVGCDLYILSDDDIVDSETYCLALYYNFNLKLSHSKFGKLIRSDLFGLTCNMVLENINTLFYKYVFMKVKKTTIFKPFNLLKM